MKNVLRIWLNLDGINVNKKKSRWHSVRTVPYCSENTCILLHVCSNNVNIPFEVPRRSLQVKQGARFPVGRFPWQRVLFYEEAPLPSLLSPWQSWLQNEEEGRKKKNLIRICTYFSFSIVSTVQRSTFFLEMNLFLLSSWSRALWRRRGRREEGRRWEGKKWVREGGCKIGSPFPSSPLSSSHSLAWVYTTVFRTLYHPPPIWIIQYKGGTWCKNTCIYYFPPSVSTYLGTHQWCHAVIVLFNSFTVFLRIQWSSLFLVVFSVALDIPLRWEKRKEGKACKKVSACSLACLLAWVLCIFFAPQWCEEGPSS